MTFTRAIVCMPGDNFADGLTHARLGRPDLELARAQHARYCKALEQSGLALTHLPADAAHADSTFIEDTAIVTRRCAVITRPGATSRQGEIAGTESALREFYKKFHRIDAPGTVDGGDVCQAGSHFFIGISERTNVDGAHQLATLLTHEGFTAAFVDIRNTRGILHLKSGISYLGDRRLVVIDALAGNPAFSCYDVLRIAAAESYAANFLRLNEHILMSAGHPQFAETLDRYGCSVISLNMSEFKKMDGALSCLSLRF